MKNLKNSKVGDIVEIYGNAYKVKRAEPSEGCRKCALIHNDCDDIPCIGEMRDDNVDVYFEEVSQEKDNSGENEVGQEDGLFKEVFDHVWEEIDENFDWSACEMMMDSVNWRWHRIGGYITADDIRDHVKKMVGDIIHKNIVEMQPTRCLSCGGYEVSYLSPQDAAIRDGYESKKGVWPSITVKFVGEECSTDPITNE